MDLLQCRFFLLPYLSHLCRHSAWTGIPITKSTAPTTRTKGYVATGSANFVMMCWICRIRIPHSILMFEGGNVCESWEEFKVRVEIDWWMKRGICLDLANEISQGVGRLRNGFKSKSKWVDGEVSRMNSSYLSRTWISRSQMTKFATDFSIHMSTITHTSTLSTYLSITRCAPVHRPNLNPLTQSSPPHSPQI